MNQRKVRISHWYVEQNNNNSIWASLGQTTNKTQSQMIEVLGHGRRQV